MIYCAECYREINKKDLKNAFQITLGNVKNDTFYGNKTFYYHKECLNDFNSHRKKVILENA